MSTQGSLPLGAAFEQSKAIFDGLSASDRLGLLRSLGGLYGHRVLPGLGAGPQRGPAKSIKEGFVPKARSTPKSQKSASQIEIQGEISKCNKEISSASKAIGNRLPGDHELVKKRDQLFRALHERTSRSASSQREEAHETAQVRGDGVSRA